MFQTAGGMQKEKDLIMRCGGTVGDPPWRLFVPWLELIYFVLEGWLQNHFTFSGFVTKLQHNLHQTWVVMPLNALLTHWKGV